MIARTRVLVLVTAGLVAAPADAAPASPEAARAAPDDLLVAALRDELARAVERLALADMPRPYYVAYSVVDHEQLTLGASFGAAVLRDRDRGRYLRVTVRVGSPELDNTNLFGDFNAFAQPVQLPLDDDYGALRRTIWIATDRAYKKAIESLEKKRAALSTQQVSSDEAGDFSPAPRASVVMSGRTELPELEPYLGLVRRLSAVYLAVPEAQLGDAVLVSTRTRRIFLSSDGSLVDEPRTSARLDAAGRTQADDGMPVERLVSHAAESVAGLPAEAALLAEARESAAELARARRAPPVEDYAGPVLFEPRAAAQLLRALLAEQLSGTPAPRGGDPRFMQGMPGLESELARRLGQRVLPAGFEVIDDPTLPALGGVALLGGYRADSEGVPASAVSLVRDGMLRDLLMSRAPRRGFGPSNGHGRAGLTGPLRARPANLVIRTAKGLGAQDLERRLAAEVRAAGLEYGIIVRALEEPDLTGEGSAGWMRDDDALPPAVDLVKVRVDGKRELVRGGTLGGLELRTLKTIVAAGRTPAVLSYFAASSGGPGGAPLGGVRAPLWGLPSSIAAPALLFADIDVREVRAPQTKPPVLPRPDVARR